MKKVQFLYNKQVITTTDRNAELLVKGGKAIKVKEEKAARETKEEKQAPRRATKKK